MPGLHTYHAGNPAFGVSFQHGYKAPGKKEKKRKM